MSAELLASLQEAHAFDPFPIREDLGLYHVPFSELVGSTHIEGTLLEACRRFERIAVIGDSGTGKSSLTASVLGPLAEGIAPVLVPVVVEPSDTVTDPGSMFAHIAAVIARFATDAATISAEQRDDALARLTAQRPVGRVGTRNLRLGAGWMGATVGADLSRQAGPAQSIGRSASEMLEVVHQMLATISNDGPSPVLVFDDTDRWLSGSAFPDHEALARSFFGRVLAALAELRCALVVARSRGHLLSESEPRIRSGHSAEPAEVSGRQPSASSSWLHSAPRCGGSPASVLGKPIHAHDGAVAFPLIHSGPTCERRRALTPVKPSTPVASRVRCPGLTSEEGCNGNEQPAATVAGSGTQDQGADHAFQASAQQGSKAAFLLRNSSSREL